MVFLLIPAIILAVTLVGVTAGTDSDINNKSIAIQQTITKKIQ